MIFIVDIASLTCIELHYKMFSVFYQDYESYAMCFFNNDAVPAEMDGTHTQPVISLETLEWAQ